MPRSRKPRPDIGAGTSHTGYNAIERLHEEFKRRIKTQTVLPCAETAAMLFWALLASGQITMRKVDGWRSLAEKWDQSRSWKKSAPNGIGRSGR